MNNNTYYYDKYLKYKNKYIKLQNMKGGNMKGGNMKGAGKSHNIFLFKASWCGACKNFIPTWNKLEQAFEKIDKIKFTTYDADEDPAVMKEWDIQGFPTIMIETSSDKYEEVNDRDFILLQNYINNIIIL